MYALIRVLTVLKQNWQFALSPFPKCIIITNVFCCNWFRFMAFSKSFGT